MDISLVGIAGALVSMSGARKALEYTEGLANYYRA